MASSRESGEGPRRDGGNAGGRRGALPRWSSFAVEHLLLLPLGSLIALVWANAHLESYVPFARRASFIVDDVLMVFFFGAIMKEIVEATAPGGVLHTWRRTVLPLISSAGGMAGSAAAFFWLVQAFDEPPLALGWPTVLAIDLGFAYFIARLMFGRHPVVAFLLLVAVVSDGVAFGALAFLNPTREAAPRLAVLLMGGAVAVSAWLRSRQVASPWPYVTVGGALSWCALFFGGSHPAFGLVPIVPFLPHAARDPGFFVDAGPDDRDTLNRFEHIAQYPAQVALFLFGLVNAGVAIRSLEAGALAAPLAMMTGRPLGILLGCGVALAVGLHLPARVGWREVGVASVVSGIGFTMALFCASSGMPPGQLLNELKMGALLSLAAAPVAFALAAALGVGRFGRP